MNLYVFVMGFQTLFCDTLITISVGFVQILIDVAEIWPNHHIHSVNLLCNHSFFDYFFILVHPMRYLTAYFIIYTSIT